MKLLTKAIERRLPPLYSQEKLGDKAVVHVKFFTPDAGWTWYATEYDPKEGLFFGLVDSGRHEAELGYFSLTELQAIRGRFGLPVERDRWWKPRTLGDVRKHAERVAR